MMEKMKVMEVGNKSCSDATLKMRTLWPSCELGTQAAPRRTKTSIINNIITIHILAILVSKIIHLIKPNPIKVLLEHRLPANVSNLSYKTSKCSKKPQIKKASIKKRSSLKKHLNNGLIDKEI